MIPTHVIEYLKQNQIPFERRPHRRAVSAQQLAASLHETGYHVAKSVLIEGGGQRWIAVLPATEEVDLDRLMRALGTTSARLLREDEFEQVFRDCEIGAEPPFGRLYGLPVIADESLAREQRIIFRAGSHEEALDVAWRDFEALEQPRVADIGRRTERGPRLERRA